MPKPPPMYAAVELLAPFITVPPVPTKMMPWPLMVPWALIVPVLVTLPPAEREIPFDPPPPVWEIIPELFIVPAAPRIWTPCPVPWINPPVFVTVPPDCRTTPFPRLPTLWIVPLLTSVQVDPAVPKTPATDAVGLLTLTKPVPPTVAGLYMALRVIVLP